MMLVSASRLAISDVIRVAGIGMVPQELLLLAVAGLVMLAFDYMMRKTIFGKAMRAGAQLRFGTVWVNDHIPLVSEMPHGGFKQSGYGKDMSVYAIEAYTEPKHVMVKW